MKCERGDVCLETELVFDLFVQRGRDGFSQSEQLVSSRVDVGLEGRMRCDFHPASVFVLPIFVFLLPFFASASQLMKRIEMMMAMTDRKHVCFHACTHQNSERANLVFLLYCLQFIGPVWLVSEVNGLGRKGTCMGKVKILA